jgi:hypothetical protein
MGDGISDMERHFGVTYAKVPTSDELSDFKAALVKQVETWHAEYDFTYGKWELDGNKLSIVTGGWSDNEHVTYKMHDNILFMMYWESTHRGGLEVFELPEYLVKAVQGLL